MYDFSDLFVLNKISMQMKMILAVLIINQGCCL